MSKIVSLRKGTCTDRATQHLISNNKNFKNFEIIYVDSFSEGINWMKSRGVLEDRILIPDVSDEYRVIVMDKNFDRDLNNSFWYENPPLYLAKKPGTDLVKTCATLATLKNLISDKFTFTYTRNTQESAGMCRNGEVDCCVTNQNGIDSYKLEIIERLKNLNVFWVPFRKLS